MAEFVADGHKYGLRWAAPWGAAQHTYGGDTRNLFFGNTTFVVSIGGGGAPVTLGINGWYREGSETEPPNDYTSYITATADTTDTVYFRLAYNPETSLKCDFTKTYVPNLPAQTLSDNEVLCRLTFKCAGAKYQKISGGSYPYLFAGTGYGSGYFRIWTNVSTTGSGWDMCFEFDAAKAVTVRSFTMNITTQSGAEISAAAGAALYLDDQELPLVGGLTGAVYGETNTRTIQRIDPLALRYKSAGGGLYEITPSSYVKRSELEALINRITALEEKTDG